MKKNDISQIKKSLNAYDLHGEDGVGSAVLKHFYSIYVKNGQEPEVLSTYYNRFSMLEDGERNVHVKNFKKVLSGAINTKIFDLTFNDAVAEDASARTILDSMISGDDKEDFKKGADSIVARMILNWNYDSDMVINFATFEYETENNIFKFVIMATNKSELGPQQLIFEHTNKTFNCKVDLDSIVNTKAPLDGFMYPVFEDGDINVSKVLNYSNKANVTNQELITEVLNCKIVLTAKEEKECFMEITKDVLGKSIEPADLHKVYSTIQSMYINEEDPDLKTIPFSSLGKVFDSLGIENTGNLEDAYLTTLSTTDYSFHVDNIVPDFSKKSIKIENSSAVISVEPEQLKEVKQVRNKDGEMFLLIKLDEGMSTEGFKLSTDKVSTIHIEEEKAI